MGGRLEKQRVRAETIGVKSVERAAAQPELGRRTAAIRRHGPRCTERQTVQRTRRQERQTSLPRVWAVAATTPESAAVLQSAPVLPVNPQLAFYRKYTEALLDQYGRVRLSVARTPSPVGQDVVRGRATYTRPSLFDDPVHFCVDVERCLNALDATDARLLRRVAIQGYSHEEAGMALGRGHSTSFRWYCAALDALTELLIQRRILDPLKVVKGTNL